MAEDQEILTQDPDQDTDQDNDQNIGGGEPVLAQPDREKLADIVRRMQANGESDENIKTAVTGFKQKYAKAAGAPASKPAPAAPQNTIQRMDMTLPVRMQNASESTGGTPATIKANVQGVQDAETHHKELEAKYRPDLEATMMEIAAHKDKYVENKRPALDYYHDAPDNFYDVPKMGAIDDYLKQTIPDATTRYYVRNRIISQFQQNKDQYHIGKLADDQIRQLPAYKQAHKEQVEAGQFGTEDMSALLQRAQQIDPTTHDKVNKLYIQAARTNEDVKNEATRAMLNNSTSLEYDDNGNLKKVNTLDPNIPFHDQITGAGKALQGFFKFSGQAGQMASGLLKFVGAKELGYNLQQNADDFMAKNAFPGGKQTPSEFLGGEALPMMLQGAAMGTAARAIGAPVFKALSGATAKGFISKMTEGALGGIALAPVNSAIIAHDYYTQMIKSGELPEIARAKADHVFSKNLVTDMAMSPLQFGIMNAPVNSTIAKAVLKFGVSPVLSGAHFMMQDYFQQKESNPSLSIWKYATSEDGIKTGITGALTGIIQHGIIGKMNDWQNEKATKDAFSFGRQDNSPETSSLPNNNVLANTVLNAFEMKDGAKRADELHGLVDEMKDRGVYNDQEATKIKGIIDDVAAVKEQVPKLGTSAQRMAVFNELLNKRSYEGQMADAKIPAVKEMLQSKMDESDERIQKVMDEKEQLYFINGIETNKSQLLDWAKENPDLAASKATKIDIIGDDDTKQALQDIRNTPAPVETAGETVEPTASETKPGITEVRHATTEEDNRGVTSGPTDVQLNEEGRDQANHLADSMEGKGVKKVVSSPLPRATETAKIVAERLGVPHVTEQELRSWDIGDFDKTKDTEFRRAEEYFVKNPDSTEFEGKKINESFNQYRQRVIIARERLGNEADGHHLVVNHGGNIQAYEAYENNGKQWNENADNGYLYADEIPPAEVRAAKPSEPAPALPGRSQEFSDFYHKFKDEIGSVEDSSFDFRVEMPQSQKDRLGAIKDIDKGKSTKRSTGFLDELQRQFDTGTLEYTRGRGNHVEKFGIPVSEWMEVNKKAEEQTIHDLRSGTIPDAELAKWLREEADKTYEHDEPTETGQASGNHETGNKGAKPVSAVRSDDEAKTRAGENSAKDESRSATDRSSRPIRETGAAKTGTDVQKPASENVEERELHADLAARLGKKLDKISEPVEVKGKPNTTDQYLTKARAVLNQLFPDHDIRSYDTENEYMAGESRPEGSAGVYDPEGKYIAFNMERIRAAGAENTIFHEVIHPIVREALQARPGAVDAAYSRLVDLKDTPGMNAVWEHEEAYRSRGTDTMKVEAITEFLSHVADGKIDPSKFNTTIRTKIIDAVNKVFKALGINKTISTAQDIKRLADSIKKAFAEADAAPVKEALGGRDSGKAKGKMDAMIGKPSGDPLEDFVREKLDEYKEPSIKKALVDTGGMKDTDAQALIDKVRNERTQSPEDIIRDAIAMGKAKRAQAIATGQQTTQIKAGLGQTLRRWYADGKDNVSDVKSIIRQNKGKEEFEIDKIYHATRKLVGMWNRVPKANQLAFMLGVEKPELLANQSQEMKDIADSYRQRLDKTFQTIQEAMPNLNFVEDYFPHFWKKPDQVRNFMSNALAKAPLEGGKSFAKKRFFETIVSGLKEGYELATTNPEEIVRLAEANAWKFKIARDILGDMDKKGLVQMAPLGEGPAGWETVKDPAFQNMAMRMKSFKSGDSKMAALYMPPEVAKLMNDYLSIGIKGPVKTFIQGYNNIKNLFQLGVGFFHFGTTTTDALVTGMTNGIQKLSAGNLKGLVDLATLGNLPATVIRGFKARAEWNAGKVTADTQALMDANARVGRQKMYSLDAKYNMMKAFGQFRANGDFSQLPKAFGNALLFLPEAINKPLMEHWVPSLKVGGYLRSLDSEIGSRKNMTPEELQTAKQKIWDSMDDRLGQVVYDNIFVKKSLKDLAFLAIRSAGWTGGTIRAVSGGAAEIPRSAQRLVKGQGLSQRTAYLAALPLTVGILGAFYQYLMTGKGPEEMKDYMFPKDGTTNADGTDHRVDFPSYMKDILAYQKSPVQTLLHKTSPMLNDLVELYQNKDFYGEKVYNSDDPFYQKGLDVLRHEAESLEPFSFKKNPYDTSPFVDQFTTTQGMEQKFGIMPAPKERERSDTQNAIMKALSDQLGHNEEGKTHDQMEQSIARRHLKEFLFNGGDWKDASDEWKDKAGIKAAGVARFVHDAKTDPYEVAFKRLTIEARLKLYNEMPENEKEKYGKYIPAYLKNGTQ